MVNETLPDMTLSELMGLGKRETSVSALVAAALDGPIGSQLLEGLLGSDRANLKVEAARPEYRLKKQRFDVLVVYEEAELLNLLAIEIKVTSEEGASQLQRYVEALSSTGELVGALTKSEVLPEGQEIASSQVLYLTVEKQTEHLEQVQYVTFGEWFEALERQGVDFAQGGLPALMLEDTLTYLGPQKNRETELLKSINEHLTIKRLQEDLRGETLLLKKIDRAVVDLIVKQFAKFNTESGAEQFTFYWSYTGRGGTLELGYYKESWMRRYDTPEISAIPKIRVSQIIRTLLDGLRKEPPTVALTARWQVEPYLPEKQLKARVTTDELRHFYDLRNGFREIVKAKIHGEGVSDYREWRTYLQVGKVEFSFEDSETLGDVARRLWLAAVELAGAMDEALGEVRLTKVAPRSEDEEDPRFSEVLKGDRPES